MSSNACTCAFSDQKTPSIASTCGFVRFSSQKYMSVPPANGDAVEREAVARRARTSSGGVVSSGVTVCAPSGATSARATSAPASAA